MGYRRKNNYGFNDFSFIKRKKIPKYLVIICAILVTSLTIGFASFSSSLVMKNIAMIRVDKTVRLTGIRVDSINNGATSRTEEYNVSNIFGDVVLPSKDSSVKYEVDITNLGNVKMGALTQSPICTPVTTATTGNVPTGNFNYGDEYTCQVGDNYSNTFFVLETSEDNVSLIMKDNFIDSYVPQTLAWCTDGTRDTTTCKNISTTGSNATDGKDYLGHIKSIFNKDGVEVSFPSASQIATASGQTFNNLSISELSTWLYVNLSSDSAPYAYWTITPDADSSNRAWYVECYGYLDFLAVGTTSWPGLRPVITLSKSSFSTDTNLDYTIDDYNKSDAIPVCDGNNCTNGVTKKIYVTIKYKNGISDSLVTSEPQNFNIGFDYKQIFKVTYSGVKCTNCMSEVIEGNTYTATITFAEPKVTMGDTVLTKGTDYTYDETTNLLTVPNVDGDLIISDALLGTEVKFNPVTAKTCSLGSNCYTWNVIGSKNNKIQLMMNKNLGDDVYTRWGGDNANENAPTLIETISNLTSTWNDSLTLKSGEATTKYLYQNGNEFVTIDFTGLKARVISAEEVASLSNIDFATLKQNDSGMNGEYISLPSWLTQNIGDDFNLTYNNSSFTQQQGYWTSTPISTSDSYENKIAYMVTKKGITSYYVGSGNPTEGGSVNYQAQFGFALGVRPVVAVDKDVLTTPDLTYICDGVTTATIGNVPAGKYAYGDEYTCEVGDSYTNTFFVVENNTDTVSLIMKENYTDSYIPTTLSWCTDGGSNTSTCKNITTTGNNAPTGKDYLGHISSIFNKNEIEVSFPSTNQIAIASGQTFNNSLIENLPKWLYGNFSTAVTPYGYWTSTPNNDDSSSSWYVYKNGSMLDGPTTYYSSYIGVRPVITIPKNKVKPTEPICTSVTTATTGNVPSGNYAYGDEYTCQVGDSYTNTFFVLENNSNTVSLIMKENYTDSYVPKTFSWCTDGGTNNTTCKNITATSSNATTGKDYLGHIKSIFNKGGVTVSFPSASQIATASGTTFNNSSISGLSTWLYGYLDETNIIGYWTSTSNADLSDYAWDVNFHGLLNYYNLVSDSDNNGFRPVITISKSLIN